MNASRKAYWSSPAGSDLVCPEHWPLALLGNYGSFQPLVQTSWALSFLDVRTEEESKLLLGSLQKVVAVGASHATPGA